MALPRKPKFKGGKKSKRDRNFGILEPGFWDWWHVRGKRARGEGDLETKRDADEAYQDYLQWKK